MKMSRRAQRMERHHKKHQGAASLNLVSLMDIFTILVFFLLVNSTDVDVLPATRLLELPEAFSEQRPRETLMITVTGDDILIQGRRVAGVAQAIGQDGERSGGDLPALTRALAGAAPSGGQPASGLNREVTIMADKGVPYRLLKRVMLSCRAAGFTQVSFAVLRKTRAPGA